MITFRPLSDDEVRALAIDWTNGSVREAWRQWEMASCVERHGEHLWELELYYPEDGSGISITCSYCPASADDLMSDGCDFVCLEIDGIEIADGKHTSRVPAVIPVTVEPWGARTWTDCGWEYDAGLSVEPRGPVRYLIDRSEGGTVGYYVETYDEDGNPQPGFPVQEEPWCGACNDTGRPFLGLDANGRPVRADHCAVCNPTPEDRAAAADEAAQARAEYERRIAAGEILAAEDESPF